MAQGSFRYQRWKTDDEGKHILQRGCWFWVLDFKTKCKMGIKLHTARHIILFLPKKKRSVPVPLQNFTLYQVKIWYSTEWLTCIKGIVSWYLDILSSHYVKVVQKVNKVLPWYMYKHCVAIIHVQINKNKFP